MGLILLLHWDDRASRERIVVGYVGENGIEADKWYKVNASGELVPAPDEEYSPFTAPNAAEKARELLKNPPAVEAAKKAAA